MLRSATFSFQRCPPLARSYAKIFTNNTKSAKRSGQKVLFDEDIKSATVQLSESGGLSHPQSLRALLASIDRSAYRLQLVKKTETVPIVKMVSRIALTQHEMNLKAQARAQARSIAANAVKEVQISGDVSLKDLEHKLTKVEEMLREDRRVDLVLTKRTQRGPGDSKEEMHNRAKDLVGRFVESGLAVEYKDKDVRPNLIAVFLRGKGKNTPVGTEFLSENRKTSVHKLYWNGPPSETNEKLEKVKSDLAKGVCVELTLAKRAERNKTSVADGGPVSPSTSQFLSTTGGEKQEQLDDETEKHKIAMQETVDSILARLSGFSSEWQEREVKSTRMVLYLQPLTNATSMEWRRKESKLKAKAMVHKGPKIRNKGAVIVDDLYQD